MSPCAVHEIIVPKRDKTSSMCIDLQLVNKCRYSFLCLDNMIDELHSTCVLSTFDLISHHHHQINMIECDGWKVVLTCDLYRWIVISVKFTNASSIFMSLLKHVLHASIDKFVLAILMVESTLS